MAIKLYVEAVKELDVEIKTHEGKLNNDNQEIL